MAKEKKDKKSPPKALRIAGLAANLAFWNDGLISSSGGAIGAIKRFVENEDKIEAQKVATMEAIWPKLIPETREWLIAHNGEPVPEHIRSEVASLDGPVVIGAAWESDATSISSFYFNDDVTDWIEQTANGE